MDISPVLLICVIVGVLFAPLAGIAGFLITYEEYSHHGLGRRRTLLISLEAAAWSAGAMLLVAVIGGVFISRL